MVLLEVRELTKRFGGLVAVDKLSFNVDKNEIFGVIGPNGAGKTTLFNLISGLYAKSGGSVNFKGNDITNVKPYMMASLGISRTFQAINLLHDMTVLENVIVGRHCKTNQNLFKSMLRTKSVYAEEKSICEKAMYWLEFVGLQAKMNILAGELSYGQQVRVGIARALASEPELLMLDEPAGGLTFEESEELGKLMVTVADKGITIMLIEHHMQFLMSLAKKVLVINYGQKICEGTPDQVYKSQDVIEAYLGVD